MSENTNETSTPELTIADLQNLRVVIDIASRRGAFSAVEMTSVGSVYDKLNAFLNAVAPAETKADAAEGQAGQ